MEHYRDFTGAKPYAAEFSLLVEDIRLGRNAVPLRPEFRTTYVTAPPLPPNYVERPEALANLRHALVTEGSGTTIEFTALEGMGGIGKTILAQALCHDEVMQQAFPDGIVWVTVGKEPAHDLVTRLREVGKALKDDLAAYDTELGCVNRYRTVMREKAALIVVDDVWRSADVEPFRTESLRSRLLFTTRDKRVAAAVSAVQVDLPLLTKDEADQLLAERSGLSVSTLPDEAADIVEFCQGLPLALAMVGAMLRGYPTRWKTALKHLQEAHLRWVAHSLGGYDYGSVMASIEVSLQQLRPAEREKYCDLAIFHKDEPIPLETLKVYWNVDLAEAQDAAILINNLSLGTLEANDAVRLHHLQVAYLREEAGPSKLQQQHKQLLDRYANICGAKWTRGPQDGYFFQHLAYHLDAAGQTAELQAVLFDYDWLATRLAQSYALTLSTDFSYGEPSDSKRKVQHALVLSSQALYADWHQLASQLIGRLLDDENPQIRNLLLAAERSSSIPWLCPLYRSLTAPLGSLRVRLFGHEQGVKALVVAQDGTRLVSGALDSTIRIWDLVGNEPCRILTGHTEGISALAVERTSGYLVSASWDKTLKVWDLDVGETVQTLRGHTECVLALGILPSTGHVVSSGPDGTIRIWDLQTGAEVRRLSNFSQSVFALTVTPDEKHVLCVGYDESVKMVDLQSGSLLRCLAGHADGASGNAIAVTDDGHYAVSASHDETLKIWDLSTGEEVRTLTGHTGGVQSVSLFPGGRLALSGADDATMRMWDLQTGENTRIFHGHEGSVEVVVASPTGAQAFSGSRDGSVAVWNLNNDSSLPRVGISGGVASMAIPKNRRQALFGTFRGELHFWDLEDSLRSKVLPGHEQAVEVAATSDGRWAVSSGRENTLRIWNLQQLTQVLCFPIAVHWLGRVAISDDGRRAAYADPDNLITWDLETGTELRRSRCEGIKSYFGAISITSDSRFVIVPSKGSVNFHDAATHEVVRSLTDCREVSDFALSLNDRLIAVSGYSDISLWDLTKPGPSAVLMSPKGLRHYVDMTSDGRVAVTAGSDRCGFSQSFTQGFSQSFTHPWFCLLNFYQLSSSVAIISALFV